MQKNWYILYTRTNCEKKVSALLTKRKIENFTPFVQVETQKLIRSKIISKPLFKNYVFAYVADQEILSVAKTTEGVINILYWLGRPAVINDVEINAIREFTGSDQHISLEKINVDNGITEKNIYRSIYKMEGNVVRIMNKSVKINLPSIGYSLVVDLKDDHFLHEKALASVNYTFAQS
ncbi:MAG: transcription termination/antitermination NusG family protein [Ferruginibacter sp.]